CRSSTGSRGRRRPPRTAGPFARSPIRRGRGRPHPPPPATTKVPRRRSRTNVKLFSPTRRPTSLPHRAPGAPAHTRQQFLSGKPIRYYRPKGSAELRALVDDGFQAFNAGRLSEACQIFTEKMLDPANDTTIGLTVAGAMTPAGLGGCVIELMERGLVDFL